MCKTINLGSKVIINRNLKTGKVTGKVIRKDKTLYYVMITDFLTKKTFGEYVYTEKQLTLVG